MQMRYQKGERTVVASREVSKNFRRLADLHSYSKGTMHIKLGPVKADHWINSGMLPERADSLRGSMDEHHKEYGAPHDWQQLSFEDFQKLQFESRSSGHTVEDMERGMAIMADPAEVGSS